MQADHPANRAPWRRTRALLLAAAALLGLALILPLWVTRMESPQYRGDEVLEVRVHAGWVTGDLREIDLLNQYVGVHLPLDTPELKAAPWLLGALTAAVLLSLMLPERARRRAALVLCISMVLFIVGGAVLLQYRLYQMGHDRSPSIMTRVPDFTPPVVGTKKIANFTVQMRLGIGSWAYLGALALIAWAASGEERGWGTLRTSSPTESAK